MTYFLDSPTVDESTRRFAPGRTQTIPVNQPGFYGWVIRNADGGVVFRFRSERLARETLTNLNFPWPREASA